MTDSFHIITRQEWTNYVGKILENNISSFGKTEKECIKNTKEALDLYLENWSPKGKISIKSPHLHTMEYTYA